MQASERCCIQSFQVKGREEFGSFVDKPSWPADLDAVMQMGQSWMRSTQYRQANSYVKQNQSCTSCTLQPSSLTHQLLACSAQAEGQDSDGQDGRLGIHGDRRWQVLAAGMPSAATPSAPGLQIGDPPQSKSLEATGIMESTSTVGHWWIGDMLMGYSVKQTEQACLPAAHLPEKRHCKGVPVACQESTLCSGCHFSHIRTALQADCDPHHKQKVRPQPLSALISSAGCWAAGPPAQVS